jgi:aspartyl aminopeptidase
MHSLEAFTQFLDRSPSVFHAAHEIAIRLKEAGFTLLKEGEKWKLEPGKGYFLIRQDTLVAAFRTPITKLRTAVILASHIDSPCLKLKPQPELISHGIGQLGTEVYGGPLLHAWLDRDLRIAGRLTGIDSKGVCHSKLVSLDDCPVIIPQLAIHLDRTIHEKGVFVHKQDHLKPIFSFRSKEKQWDQWLAKHHSFSQLLSFDLFLTPLEKASFLGFDKELIASYRLDNLTSAYASLAALIQADAASDQLQMALFWDHEEIGSLSYVGADSLFANQVMERICMHYKMDREDYYQMKSRSLCLSADLAHGYHPNYSDKYDAQNASFVGKGVVIKFNANQKYATSSATAAPLIRIAENHKIPIQKFAGRSDIPSGSTVGSIMAANLGVPTLDLGISGWAMHSTREVIAGEDQISLGRLLQACLEEVL